MSTKKDYYFNTVTVGKRGQIVIPAKIRKEMDIHPQDQLVVISASQQEGFVVIKSGVFIQAQEKFDTIKGKLFQ